MLACCLFILSRKTRWRCGRHSVIKFTTSPDLSKRKPTSSFHIIMKCNDEHEVIHRWIVLIMPEMLGRNGGLTWQSQVLIPYTFTLRLHFLSPIPCSVLRPLLVSWGLEASSSLCANSYRRCSISHCHLIPHILMGTGMCEKPWPHTQQYLKGTGGEIFIKRN